MARKKKQTAPVYYDWDEDLFFDRLNHYNLMRFWDALEFVRYENGPPTTDADTQAAVVDATAVLRHFYGNSSASCLPSAK
jgi:hypothetical protein